MSHLLSNSKEIENAALGPYVLAPEYESSSLSIIRSAFCTLRYHSLMRSHCDREEIASAEVSRELLTCWNRSSRKNTDFPANLPEGLNHNPPVAVKTVPRRCGSSKMLVFD
jgi:hypothetical protein